MLAKPRRLVLIVEDDLGFVFWLGNQLNEAGYDVLPAKEIAEAKKLSAKIHRQPDLLVVNVSLISALVGNGWIESLPGMKVLALIDSNSQSHRTLSRVDAVIMRPNTLLAASVVLRNIERLFARHFTA